MSHPAASLHSTVDKLWWSLRCRGVIVTALTCVGNLCRFAKTEPYWKFKEWAFDRIHRVKTSGLVWVEDLDVCDADKDRGWGYMATQPEWFGIVLSRLEIDYREYQFVDLGSGKARSLLLAAEFPFAAIVGVEFSPSLHEAAVQNIRSWKSRTQQCHRVTACLNDATRCTLPDTPLVVYMYNPFKRDVLTRVRDRIAASWRENPRPIFVVYANPTCREIFDDDPLFKATVDASEHNPVVVVYHVAGE